MAPSALGGGPWRARMRALAGETAVVAGCALLLAAPAILVGRPFVYYDTASYLLTGEAAASLPGPSPIRLADYDLGYLGGRAPAYGLALYLLDRVGGLWLAVAAQALAAGWLLRLAVRAAAPRRDWRAALAVCAALSAGTGLGFSTVFMMPDVFGGLAALALSLLFALRDRIGGAGRVGLLALLAFAAATHVSVGLLGVAGVLAGAALSAAMGARGGSLLRPVATAGAALLVGVMANAVLFGWAGQRLHVQHHRPPFLSARVLADGPGQRFLREACARRAPYELCRFQTRDLADSQVILWSKDPTLGVFSVADSGARTRMSEQDLAFWFDVLRHDPPAVLRASLQDVWQELTSFSTAEQFIAPRAFLSTALRTRTPEAVSCAANDACRSLPHAAVKALQLAVLGLCGLYLAWRLTRRDVRLALAARRGAMVDAPSRALLFTALAALLIVANAVICGTLSGVASRYQSRIFWMEPVCAIVTWLMLRWGPPRASDGRSP